MEKGLRQGTLCFWPVLVVSLLACFIAGHQMSGTATSTTTRVYLLAVLLLVAALSYWVWLRGSRFCHTWCVHELPSGSAFAWRDIQRIYQAAVRFALLWFLIWLLAGIGVVLWLGWVFPGFSWTRQFHLELFFAFIGIGGGLFVGFALLTRATSQFRRFLAERRAKPPLPDNGEPALPSITLMIFLVMVYIILFSGFCAIVLARQIGSHQAAVDRAHLGRQMIEAADALSAQTFAHAQGFTLLAQDGKWRPSAADQAPESEAGRVRRVCSRARPFHANWAYAVDYNDRYVYLVSRQQPLGVILRAPMPAVVPGFAALLLLGAALLLCMIMAFGGYVWLHAWSASLSDQLRALLPEHAEPAGGFAFWRESVRHGRAVSKLKDLLADAANQVGRSGASGLDLAGALSNKDRYLVQESTILQEVLAELTQTGQDILRQMSMAIGSVTKLEKSQENTHTQFSKLEPVVQRLGERFQRFVRSILDHVAAIDGCMDRFRALTDILAQTEPVIHDSEGNIGRMQTQTEELAKTSKIMHGLLRKYSESGASGRQVVMRNTQAMQTIHQSFLQIQKHTEQLFASTRNVDMIIVMIQDIAKKTNLLALNASIIASQAGEYGRSFLIVANEIRSLAERTTVSIRDIEKMIDAVKGNLADIDTSLAKGKHDIKQGLQLADHVDRHMENTTGLAQQLLDSFQTLEHRVLEEQSHLTRLGDNLVEQNNLYKQLVQQNERIQTVLASEELTALKQNQATHAQVISSYVDKTREIVQYSQDMYLHCHQHLDALTKTLKQVLLLHQQQSVNTGRMEQLKEINRQLHQDMQELISSLSREPDSAGT